MQIRVNDDDSCGEGAALYGSQNFIITKIENSTPYLVFAGTIEIDSCIFNSQISEDLSTFLSDSDATDTLIYSEI